MSKDYYDILEVNKGASADEIKSAFKKKAMKYHPDRNKAADAEARFKEINEAYEVLGDPQKKKNYDQYGSAQGPEAGFGGGGFENFYQQGEGGGFGFNFEEIFEFMNGGRQKKSTQPDKGKDIEYEISISLEEAFHGKTVDIEYYKMQICGICNGSCVKGSGQSTCAICHGTGRTRTVKGFAAIERVCYGCKGTGISSDSLCGGCKGEGRLNKKTKLSIKIPMGIQTGKKIRIKSEGDSGVRGGPTGDFLLYVNVQPNKTFEVDGQNIHTKINVNLVDALLGATMKIKGIDGKDVDVVIPECLANNSFVVVKNHGMPGLNNEIRGDLICHCAIQMPKKLNGEQKELIKKAFTESSSWTSKFF